MKRIIFIFLLILISIQYVSSFPMVYPNNNIYIKELDGWYNPCCWQEEDSIKTDGFNYVELDGQVYERISPYEEVNYEVKDNKIVLKEGINIPIILKDNPSKDIREINNKIVDNDEIYEYVKNEYKDDDTGFVIFILISLIFGSLIIIVLLIISTHNLKGGFKNEK